MTLLPALEKKPQKPTSCQRMTTEIEAIRVSLLGGSRQAPGKSFSLIQVVAGLRRGITQDSEYLTFSQQEASVSDGLTKEDHNIIINSVE